MCIEEQMEFYDYSSDSNIQGKNLYAPQFGVDHGDEVIFLQI